MLRHSSSQIICGLQSQLFCGSPWNWIPASHLLPAGITSIMLERSYFSACLGDLIYCLTLNRPLPPAKEYWILQIKNWRLIYLLSSSLIQFNINIFFLLSDKTQGCRKAMPDKNYKWGSVPRFKGGWLFLRQVMPQRQFTNSNKKQLLLKLYL